MKWWIWRIGRVAWSANRGQVVEGAWRWKPVVWRLCVRLPNAESEVSE